MRASSCRVPLGLRLNGLPWCRRRSCARLQLSTWSSRPRPLRDVPGAKLLALTLRRFVAPRDRRAVSLSTDVFCAGKILSVALAHGAGRPLGDADLRLRDGPARVRPARYRLRRRWPGWNEPGGGRPSGRRPSRGFTLGVAGAAGNPAAGGSEMGGAPGVGGASGSATSAAGSSSGGPPVGGQTIINDRFWKDSAGTPIYSQGGGVLQVADTYYWYGVKYAGTVAYAENPVDNDNTGFQGITTYSSKDLVNWKLEASGARRRKMTGYSIPRSKRIASPSRRPWVGRSATVRTRKTRAPVTGPGKSTVTAASARASWICRTAPTVYRFGPRAARPAPSCTSAVEARIRR